MLPSISIIALVFLGSSKSLITQAHQLVTIPAPTYIIEGKSSQWNPLAFLEDQGYSTSADFEGWLSDNNYDSLRAFMDDESAYTVNSSATFQCGFTDINGERQEIPTDGKMKSTGYTHDGPCEIWLDDTMVYANSDCHTSLPGTPATYDFDYSACGESCTMYWFWLGNRYIKNEYSWQIYKACINLGSSSTTSVASDADTTTDTTVTTSSTAGSTTTTPTPTSTTATPSTSVATPSVDPSQSMGGQSFGFNNMHFGGQ